ncbi:MAG TPA: SLBB domain-containing protein [Gemmatimonadales bacterium]
MSQILRSALLTSLLAGAALLPVRSLAAQAPSQQPPDSSASQAAARPGDIIRLKVWREPDWSGDFEVQQSGVAILPRLGAIDVRNMSSDSLTRFLVDSLGRFLRNPSIQVNLLHRIRILGAVKNPGLYPVDPSITVIDALALAGGATSEGKPDRVVLRREGERIKVPLNKNTRLADTPMQTGDQLYVPERGWVSRNAGLVAAGLSAATTVVVTLLLRQ